MIKIANCNLLNEEAQKVYDEYDMANFIFKTTVNEIFEQLDFDYNRKYVLESIDEIQVSLKKLKNLIEDAMINDDNE